MDILEIFHGRYLLVSFSHYVSVKKLKMINISSIDEIADDVNFVIFKNAVLRYTEDWYGPPDPKPTGYSNFKHLHVTTAKTFDEVKRFLDSCKPDDLKNYKIVKIEKILTPKVEIKISI